MPRYASAIFYWKIIVDKYFKITILSWWWGGGETVCVTVTVQKVHEKNKCTFLAVYPGTGTTQEVLVSLHNIIICILLTRHQFINSMAFVNTGYLRYLQSDVYQYENDFLKFRDITCGFLLLLLSCKQLFPDFHPLSQKQIQLSSSRPLV